MPTVSHSSPSVALTSLRIRDFRGIEELTLDFRRPDGSPNQLVVLAGPNGCGKTAVLEAALIAVGGQKLIVGRSGKQAIRKGAKEYTIEAEFRDQATVEEEIQTVLFTPHSPATESKSPISHWYFSSWRSPNSVGPVNVTVGKPGRRPAKTDKNRLLNVKQQLANAAAAENFRGAKRPLFQQYSKWIAQLNEGWKTFYPSHNDRFDVELVEDSSGEPFDVMYTRSGLPLIPVDDLSAGQLELFLFMAALVLNDDREGIVFIDEPELHLDPQWHAPLLRALMRLQPKAQFVVATHSPEIYDAAMSYERHFLVPEDDPRASSWPNIGAMLEA